MAWAGASPVFAPGPAMVALDMGENKAVIFVAAMLAVMAAFELLKRRKYPAKSIPAGKA